MNRNERKEDTKRRILETAIEMFGAKGRDGVSVKDISDSVGVSKAIIFHYYNSKDDLYLECVKQFVEDLCLYLEKFSGVHFGDDIKDSKMGIGVRGEFLLGYPQYSGIFSEIVLYQPEDLKAQIREIGKPIFEHSKKFYENLLKDVKLGKGVSKEDATMMFSMLRYSLPDMVANENISDKDNYILRLFRIFLNGLSVDLD